jgi:hypothetical protein
LGFLPVNGSTREGETTDSIIFSVRGGGGGGVVVIGGKGKEGDGCVEEAARE